MVLRHMFTHQHSLCCTCARCICLMGTCATSGIADSLWHPAELLKGWLCCARKILRFASQSKSYLVQKAKSQRREHLKEETATEESSAKVMMYIRNK